MTTPLTTPEPARTWRPPAGAPGDDALTATESFILEMLERLDAADAKAGSVQLALGHSRDIGAAVGILMAHHKMQQVDAFELVRSTSQDQNRKLYELALEVVRTGELPTRADRSRADPRADWWATRSRPHERSGQRSSTSGTPQRCDSRALLGYSTV